MWRTFFLIGVLPFISAFLGGVLALSLVAAPQAAAQAGEAQEVRASAFTLVGPDDTILARLAPSGLTGDGVLLMYDAAGTRRLGVVGSGAVNVFGQDGTTLVFRAGRSFDVGQAGSAPVNGVLLGPDGSIGMLPPAP